MSEKTIKHDIVYMNERIDFIKSNLEKATLLYEKLKTDKVIGFSEYDVLEKLHREMITAIANYYTYLESVNIKGHESYLTIWLDEYNNNERIDTIGYFLENSFTRVT
jgi:hypothetical protein